MRQFVTLRAWAAFVQYDGGKKQPLASSTTLQKPRPRLYDLARAGCSLAMSVGLRHALHMSSLITTSQQGDEQPLADCTALLKAAASTAWPLIGGAER